MEDCGGICIYPAQQCCPTNSTLGVTCPGSYTFSYASNTYTVPAEYCKSVQDVCACQLGEWVCGACSRRVLDHLALIPACC